MADCGASGATYLMRAGETHKRAARRFEMGLGEHTCRRTPKHLEHDEWPKLIGAQRVSRARQKLPCRSSRAQRAIVLIFDTPTGLAYKRNRSVALGARVHRSPRHAEHSVMDATFEFTVNAKAARVVTDPDRPLLDVLREELGLTGTKYGCGEGECGACTVLVDGVATRSCITSISEANGRKIVTIEGLAGGEQAAPRAAGLCRKAGGAVRLLRAGPDHERRRLAPAASPAPPANKSSPACGAISAAAATIRICSRPWNGPSS